jgi:selenocysteine-specific translation elongation factor
MPGLVCRPIADARATVPLVAVTARDGATAQTQEFLQLVENLKHRKRFVPLTTVDLTDPPAGAAAVAGEPTWAALQRAG